MSDHSKAVSSPRLQPVFTANKFPPIVGEDTDGFYRRLLVLQYETMPEKKINEDLFFKPNELAYLMQKSVQAYQEVIQSGGKIAVSPNSKKQNELLRANNDSVYSFIKERCNVGVGLSCKRSDLAVEYSYFCGETERIAKGKKEFFSSLKAKGFSDKKDSNGNIRFLGLEYSGRWHNGTAEYIERTETKTSIV